MKIFKTLAILFSALCTKTVAKKADVNLMSMIQGKKLTDSGHSVNCGKHPIDIVWTPKDLSPSGEVTFYLSYLLPYDLDRGHYDATVYEHGAASPSFAFEDLKFTCEQIHHCPLRAGNKLRCQDLQAYKKMERTMYLNVTKTIPELYTLSGYPGHYDVILKMWNVDQQDMFCVNLTVNIVYE